MAREYRHALDDMQAAIAGIEAASAGKTLDDYTSDWLLKHAIQRGIEIISEASRALPEDIRKLRPDIPWAQIRTIGNVLRHEYHGLSDSIIWRVVTDELPSLREAVDWLSEYAPPPERQHLLRIARWSNGRWMNCAAFRFIVTMFYGLAVV